MHTRAGTRADGMGGQEEAVSQSDLAYLSLSREIQDLLVPLSLPLHPPAALRALPGRVKIPKALHPEAQTLQTDSR